jgi:hypothetical protein
MMTASFTQNIINKLVQFGAGTINSLIYGNTDNDTLYEFLRRGNEGGTHEERVHVYREGNTRCDDSEWKTVNVRNDKFQVSQINELARHDILEVFSADVDLKKYKYVRFYRLSSFMRRAFHGIEVPMDEINDYVITNYRKNYSNRPIILAENDRLKRYLSEFACRYLSYQCKPLGEYLKEHRDIKQDPGYFERTTHMGTSDALGDFIRDDGLNYFRSLNLFKLDQRVRKELIIKFFNHREDVMVEYRKQVEKMTLLQNMKNDGVMEFYREHKAQLLEIIKRTKDLDKINL